MGKLAILFAGQGAQYPGMGKDLYENNRAAAAVFEAAEKQRAGTMAECFEGTAEQLAITSVTQPCVYTVALAAAQALRAGGVVADAVAGFSLGEMAALTFAGAFGPEEGFELVCRRGALMQQAATQHPGAMVAVLRLPNDTVEALCKSFDEWWPVNYNCDGQLVVAGKASNTEGFCAAVKQAGGMAKPLAVGGAFHTPYMQGAADAFLGDIKAAGMKPPALPVYANRTAQPYAAPPEETLALQMVSPVRWSETIGGLAQQGFDRFIEVGPGKTLTGFAKRIVPKAALYTVQDTAGLAAALEGNS